MPPWYHSSYAAHPQWLAAARGVTDGGLGQKG